MKILFISLIIFISALPHLSAQENQHIAVVITPDTLITTIPFNITLLIDYPEPEEVTVTAPAISAPLSVDRIVTHPWTTGDRIQTIVEYRLISTGAGHITLDSFVVNTPENTMRTGQISLYFRSITGEQRIISPPVSWEGIRSGVMVQMTAGERRIFTIRANGWNAPHPPSAFFMPAVPQGVILSAQPVSAEEREGGVLAKLMLIPLAAGDYSIPARVLFHENFRFDIPSLRIRAASR
ncbi:MAG: hypothetical protein FWD40_11225 [Treponema sp.]|nr:hypothetical protein [Treponema sp.]